MFSYYCNPVSSKLRNCKIPDLKLLDFKKYLANQLLHVLIQSSNYPLQLKQYIIKENGLGDKLDERREKKYSFLEQNELDERKLRRIKKSLEHSPAQLFGKIARDDLDFKFNNLKHSWQIVDDTEVSTSSVWEGKENILEGLIAELLNYTNIRVRRQFPLREKDKTSKVKTRCADLVLFYKYQYESGFKPLNNETRGSLICIELKPNYIDITNVTECWYTKRYLQQTIELFPNVQDAALLFLSPQGITETAAYEIRKINKEARYFTRNNKNDITMRAYSATVNQFLKAVYWCAKYSYRDEQGAIGKQWSYVKPEVDKIIWKINNPNFWLEDHLKTDNKVKLEIQLEKS